MTQCDSFLSLWCYFLTARHKKLNESVYQEEKNMNNKEISHFFKLTNAKRLKNPKSQ